MKFQALAIVALALLGSFPLGCDRLPEAFSGKAAPETKPISAAGPSGQSTAPGHAEVTPGTPIAIGELDSDPKLKNIDQPGTEFNSNGPRVQLVNNETPIADADENAFQPSTLVAADAPPESIKRDDGIIVIEYAQLKFLNDIDVAAPADGIITKLDWQEGDSVGAGEVLVELDNRLVQAELEVAKNEAIAAIEKSKDISEIEYAKSAEEVAKQDLDNSTELMNRKVESAGDHRKKWLEHRRSELAITVADLKHSQDGAAANVSRAKQHKAEVQIDMLTVKSKFPGIIAKKEKDVNEWVRAGDILMRLVSLEKLRVNGRLHVNSLQVAPHLLVGAPAKITIQLYPNAREVVEGKVGFVSPVQDSAGVYAVWVEIPNQLIKDQWLFREGMVATIEIDTKR